MGTVAAGITTDEGPRMESMAELIARQDGVINRAQAATHGLADHDVRRLIRRREWRQVRPGVYVDHTGPLTGRQRAWVAVLALWPAALCHESAVGAAEGDYPDEGRVLHVAVARNRGRVTPTGVRCHRIADFEAEVTMTTSPPRQRYESAVLDVAARTRDDLDAVATLAKAVGARATTPQRLSRTLADRARSPRRTFLAGVLRDLELGTCSVLEHGYLDLVERPHAVPTADRQVSDSIRGTVYRDVEYAVGMVVELDGRATHASFDQHDLDLDRDLDTAVTGRLTVRLGWGQVFRRPCDTARRVGVLLNQRGWPGTADRGPSCPETCRIPVTW